MNIDDKLAGLRMAGGGALATVYGLTLNEWVAVITIAYFIIQIVILMPKFVKTLSIWAGWIKERFGA